MFYYFICCIKKKHFKWKDSAGEESREMEIFIVSCPASKEEL